MPAIKTYTYRTVRLSSQPPQQVNTCADYTTFIVVVMCAVGSKYDRRRRTANNISVTAQSDFSSIQFKGYRTAVIEV